MNLRWKGHSEDSGAEGIRTWALMALWSHFPAHGVWEKKTFWNEVWAAVVFEVSAPGGSLELLAYTILHKVVLFVLFLVSNSETKQKQ